jgi:hypothetical protein
VFKSRENQYRITYAKAVILKELVNIVTGMKDEKEKKKGMRTAQNFRTQWLNEYSNPLTNG